MTVSLRHKRSKRPRRIAREGGRLAPPPPSGGVQASGRHRPAQQHLSGDLAMYSCSCGFVFDAPVSTSVGCPHCGETQAW